MKTLVFFLAMMAPAFARLGESLEECKARYGEPVEVNQEIGAASFRKAGFTLVMQFDAGRVGLIIITKDKEPGKFSIGNPEMSATELETFMTSNSGGSTWEEREDFDFVNKTYDTKDGKRIAIQDTVNNTLAIYTLAHLKKMAEAKALEEKKNLDGF